MKLSVCLGKLNGKWAIASIENDDENVIDVTDGHHKDPKAACLAAAKALREAAFRFEALSHEKEPFNYKTHDRINKGRVSVTAPSAGEGREG